MQKKIKKRIAIGQIWQEQNTFCPIKTTISDFKQNGLFYGKEVTEKFKGTNELGGFIKAAYVGNDICDIILLQLWPGSRPFIHRIFHL